MPRCDTGRSAALAVSLLVIAVATVLVQAAYGRVLRPLSPGRRLRARRAAAHARVRREVPGREHRQASRSVHLVDRRVQVRLSIDKGFQVPADTEASVRPKTLFGEKYIDFSFPDGRTAPFLPSRRRTSPRRRRPRRSRASSRGRYRSFRKINATDLATIINELSKGLEGEGRQHRQSLHDGVQLADVFADTIDAQTHALDSFARFQDAIKTVGPDLNAISANSNLALPEFNQARGDYSRLLTTLKPFADNLADVLRVYRARHRRASSPRATTWCGSCSATQADISDTVSAASTATPSSSPRGPAPRPCPTARSSPTSRTSCCSATSRTSSARRWHRPSPAPTFLVPLQQALLASGGPLDCSAYFSQAATRRRRRPPRPGRQLATRDAAGAGHAAGAPGRHRQGARRPDPGEGP